MGDLLNVHAAFVDTTMATRDEARSTSIDEVKFLIDRRAFLDVEPV